jgi:phenylpropionate dioxygenase-like ring-hydroxylating dioxygenase large terminal subunit
MLSLLSQEDYVSDEVLALEQVKLFRRLWIFGALKQLLTEPNAFATRIIGGIPIVLQNCNGTIKAFSNQCLHRQMPLQWGTYGKRPLLCRYHGWSYDNNGSPKHIPAQQELYCFQEQEVGAMRLRQFAVECVGNLVFVNLGEDPIPIREQFSDALLARLAAISGSFDTEVIHAHIDAKYNWKLNFENVLDGNHVRYLHPRTFMPYMQGGTGVVQKVDAGPLQARLEEIRDCKLSDLSYESTAQFKLAPKAWHRDVSRFGSEDVYYNFFLYPNVNFISIGGYVFLVQQFNPVTPGKTEVDFSLMTARKNRRIPASAAILWAHMSAEKEVLNEDIRALEVLQASLHSGGVSANHGAYEKQLMMNHAIYRQLMGAEA